jgi:hypothetical protein
LSLKNRSVVRVFGHTRKREGLKRTTQRDDLGMPPSVAT